MAGFVSKGTCTWCCLRQLRDKQISAPACQSLQRLLQWPCLGVVIYPAQMVSATSYSPEALFLQQLLCGNGVDRMESPWESTSSHVLSMASLNRSSSLVTESLHPYTNLPVAADNHFFLKDSTVDYTKQDLPFSGLFHIHTTLQVPHCCKRHDFFIFNGWIIFCYTDIGDTDTKLSYSYI